MLLRAGLAVARLVVSTPTTEQRDVRPTTSTVTASRCALLRSRWRDTVPDRRGEEETAILRDQQLAQLHQSAGERDGSCQRVKEADATNSMAMPSGSRNCREGFPSSNNTP